MISWCKNHENYSIVSEGLHKKTCIPKLLHQKYKTLKWKHIAAATAAKLLQLCPTLCDPTDGSPPGSPRPWDSPGKNTGVGCHVFLQCMKVKRESEVAQSCPPLREPMDWGLPGSSFHGIFQARILEWGAITFSHISWLQNPPKHTHRKIN